MWSVLGWHQVGLPCRVSGRDRAFPRRSVFAALFTGSAMACGATLRRSVKWDALLGPQSPKRRRCTFGPPRPAGEQRLTPGVCETSDSPAFTLRQVGYLCEQLADEHELKVREEYEEILNTKLSEQYESFVKFTQDLIIHRYGSRPASYVS